MQQHHASVALQGSDRVQLGINTCDGFSRQPGFVKRSCLRLTSALGHRPLRSIRFGAFWVISGNNTSQSCPQGAHWVRGFSEAAAGSPNGFGGSWKGSPGHGLVEA